MYKSSLSSFSSSFSASLPPPLSLSQSLYRTEKAYDPEGVLGSLTSIVLCFLGVQAGRILTSYRGRHLGIIIRFVLWGVVLVSH